MEGKKHINIEHPEAWELLVSIGDTRVDYILFAPSVSGSLIVGDVTRTDNTLQSLEDAVLDTPELLNEYRRIRVVVRSQHFVLLPQSTADDDCVALVRAAFPNDPGDAAVCALPQNNVKVAWLMPRGVQAFVGRTFNYPVVYHHLAPLCEHFMQLNSDADVSHMFVHLSGGHMDMAVYRDGGLVCANTYPCTDASDATYYVLNAWRTHGLDQLTDELQLLGDGDLRAQLTPALREYVKQVMPAVYPAAAMRLGRNAMQAPLELIQLALCE